MGGAIGAIGGIINAIKPIADIVGKFVPAIGQISQSLTGVGRFADVLSNFFKKNDNGNQAADDQKDKTRAVLNTVAGAADTANKFARGDVLGGVQGAAGLLKV